MSCIFSANKGPIQQSNEIREVAHLFEAPKEVCEAGFTPESCKQCGSISLYTASSILRTFLPSAFQRPSSTTAPASSFSSVSGRLQKSGPPPASCKRVCFLCNCNECTSCVHTSQRGGGEMHLKAIVYTKDLDLAFVLTCNTCNMCNRWCAS